MARGFRFFRRIRGFIKKINVTYNVDTGISYVEQVKKGDTVLSPTSFVPTKSNYTFVGWREDDVASDNVLVTKDAGNTDITLYAVFGKEITLTKYNGSNTASTDKKNQYYNNANIENPSFTLTLNALSGWTKYGWTNNTGSYSKSLNDGDSITLSGPATYYSLYTKSVTVTKYNGSHSATTESKNRVANVHSTTTYQDPEFTLTLNALSGWTKYGWTNSSSGYSRKVVDGGKVTLSSDATYYSLYTQSVTLTKYNGSTSASTASGTRIANVHSLTSYSDPAFTLTEAAVSGKVKAGWKKDSIHSTTIIPDGSTIYLSANATYYSYYSVTLTGTFYDAGSQVITKQANIYYTYYSSILEEYPIMPTVNQTAISGWTARGWTTDSVNGDGAIYPYYNPGQPWKYGSFTVYGAYQGAVNISFADQYETVNPVSGTAYYHALGNNKKADLVLPIKSVTRVQQGPRWVDFRYWNPDHWSNGQSVSLNPGSYSESAYYA